MGAWLAAGSIWIIVAVSKFSGFDAVSVRTVLAACIGVATIFAVAAARMLYRDR